MTEQEILMLAGMVKEISETVWDIALIRVYALSIQYSIWAVLFFVMWVGGTWATVRVAIKNRDEKDNIDAWVMGALSLLALIIFGAFLSSSIGRAVAPEWYALRQIMYHLR